MRRAARLLVLLVAALGLVGAVQVVAPVEASASHFARGYNIKNSINSNRVVHIYDYTGCNPAGDIFLLYANQKAITHKWSSFKVYGTRSWNVLVYDDVTGNLLADRNYAGGTCVNTAGNSYLVTAV